MGLGLGCSKDRDINPIANIREAAKDRDLQSKTFSGACSIRPLTAISTKIQSGLALKSARIQYRIDGDNITRSTLLYERTDCSGDVAYTFREMGTVSLSPDQRTRDNAKMIDINYTALKLRVDSQDGAQVANGTKLCNISNWQAGQERDVTPTSDDSGCYGIRVPRTDFNVYRIDGNTLYWGSSESSSRDRSDRPTSLDLTEKYVHNP